MNARPWTDAELQTLRYGYPHMPTAVLAEQLGRSVGQVYQAAERHGLRKTAQYMASAAACRLRRGDQVGERYRWPKGHVPWNKGAPGSTGLHPNTAAHHFKPGTCNGRAAQLVLPVGTLRINADGVLERKVADTPGPSNRRWKPVHTLLWVAAHGPVPAGHVVVFRRGQKTSELGRISLDRLECISRAEIMRRNSLHTTMPPELARLVQLQGALQRQINRRQRLGTTQEQA